ncbi:hypothetical protein [Oerskovia flava]|uniref:hypothetical protein n=1 Tax=Oerskovia flava TaxID=2986422 RepID=UPI00223EB726|nr:hypothetical protein [Oerskovia sp. JB1-3-2]
MSSDEPTVEELLVEVGEESEAVRHRPLPDDAVGVRRGDGAAPRVLSVRLTAPQYARLAAAAEARDLPVSTMARLAILEQLDDADRPASSPIELTTVAAALREVIRPEFLRAG